MPMPMNVATPFRFVDVVVDVPNLPSLTYSIPQGAQAQVGLRCIVPLGRRRMIGMITALRHDSSVPESKQKACEHIFNDLAPMSPSWLSLMRFAAQYYQHSLGEVMMGNLPSFFRTLPRPQYETSLKRLRRLKEPTLEASSESPQLNEQQEQAVKRISQAKGFVPYVIHGVTGSGKTEVYLHAMHEVLKKEPHAQILFLVPEINLTPQLESRVRERFPQFRVVCMHSALSAGERARSWLAMHEQKATILIGTRMAIFANIPSLRLIVVDEEHDLSYKAGDGVRYCARDLAIKAAQIHGIPVILGSATPSIETWYKVRENRFELCSLTHRAVANAIMPKLVLVDPRVEPVTHGLCKTVIDSITRALSEQHQVIIFLNRRGYAPVITCQSCNWLSTCPHCSTHAVYHKSTRKLVCHHCGWTSNVPIACPDCGNTDLVPLGAGTQKIEETLGQLWPQARILRVDRDSTQRKNAAQEAFEKIHTGQADLIVGTQILAKGHDFQNVSCVVVLNIDAQLASASSRSEERAFANLMQVSGRAGRSGLPATVVVQTRFADRYLFDALAEQNYEKFADQLLLERQMEGAVPYCYQALLLADDPKMDNVLFFLQKAARIADFILQDSALSGVAVYDPVPMPVMKVADRERAQLLVECPSRVLLNRFLRLWIEKVRLEKTHVHWTVDVDPIDV